MPVLRYCPNRKTAQTLLLTGVRILQNTVGKTLMKILVARAKDQIHELVMQYPQTAYVPHRSCFETGLPTLRTSTTPMSEA